MAMSLCLISCSGMSTSTKNQLRVGISTDYPPVAYKKDGEIVGIEADLAKEIANRLDRNLVLVDMPWGVPLVEYLNNNDIDVVMAGVTITEKRKEVVDFTDAYLRVGQMAITRKDVITAFSSKEQLINTTANIGVTELTTGQIFAKENLKYANIISYKNIETGIVALKMGDIDAFIHDAPAVWLATDGRQHPELIGLYWPLTDEYLGWAVKKGNSELTDILNKELLELKSTGRLYNIINNNIKVRITVD